MTYDDLLSLRMKLSENYWVQQLSTLTCMPLDGIEERDDGHAPVVDRALEASMLAFRGLAATHVVFGREDDPDDVILVGDDPDILLLRPDAFLKDGWQQPSHVASAQ